MGSMPLDFFSCYLNFLLITNSNLWHTYLGGHLCTRHSTLSLTISLLLSSPCQQLIEWLVSETTSSFSFIYTKGKGKSKPKYFFLHIFSNHLPLLKFFRYLYPVDKSRIDMSGMIEETPDSNVDAPLSTETKSVEKSVTSSGMVTRRRAKKE